RLVWSHTPADSLEIGAVIQTAKATGAATLRERDRGADRRAGHRPGRGRPDPVHCRDGCGRRQGYAEGPITAIRRLLRSVHRLDAAQAPVARGGVHAVADQIAV